MIHNQLLIITKIKYLLYKIIFEFSKLQLGILLYDFSNADVRSEQATEQTGHLTVNMWVDRTL